MTLAQRLDDIRGRITAAARACGRDPSEVKLVAVSKLQPVDKVLEAYDLGVRDFGENTVQGLCAKAEALVRSGREARWHFIGRLQRNKINKLLPHLCLLHTLDRMELAEALARRVSAAPLECLVEVNIGREPQKDGVDPEQAVELARAAAGLGGLMLAGLMAIPPFGEDPRPHFETMSRLLRELRATPEGAGAGELSMGMTEDFETAIACGATLVRIGTGVFGERPAKGPSEA